jgi:transcriptional regulator with XRE-family HTH domain
MEYFLGDWMAGKGPGEVLAHARKSRRLTQAELAKRLDVSKANISRIEHGADLRVSTLLEIARALNLEPLLVPKEHLAAVRALLDVASTNTGEEPSQKPRFS